MVLRWPNVLTTHHSNDTHCGKAEIGALAIRVFSPWLHVVTLGVGLRHFLASFRKNNNYSKIPCSSKMYRQWFYPLSLFVVPQGVSFEDEDDRVEPTNGVSGVWKWGIPSPQWEYHWEYHQYHQQDRKWLLFVKWWSPYLAWGWGLTFSRCSCGPNGRRLWTSTCCWSMTGSPKTKKRWANLGIFCVFYWLN
jgi:hypothetical protein